MGEPDGQALFAFVRYWSRRWNGADPERGRDVMVLEAVRALAASGRAASINAVAHELGVDQSGASRMVTHAQRRGLVVRQAPARVGAAASIALTEAGEELLAQAHAWQNDVLRRLTADWPDHDVTTLLALMNRLVRAQAAIER